MATDPTRLRGTRSPAAEPPPPSANRIFDAADKKADQPQNHGCDQHEPQEVRCETKSAEEGKDQEQHD
jgi:hypothetical protein